ncbi:unnamed protein product, partial [marine sediment metagenome]
NQLSTLPTGTFPDDAAAATDNMSLFPSTAATADAGAGAKDKDPDGENYVAADKNGYILYQHDITGGDGVPPTGGAAPLVNYVAQEMTKGTYYVNASGTVTQESSGY